MSRLIKSIFICMTICCVMLAGCSNSTTSPQNNKGSAQSNKEDRTLTIGMPVDMASFDIHNHNTITTEAIHVNMFNYLFKRTEDLEFKPDLVDTYKLVNDTTWEFSLKEGVTFHNGDPLSSSDVKFTLDRVSKDQTLKENSQYKQIKEVKVLDDLHFQIITDGPQPALLNRLSRIGSGILPKKYIDEKGWDAFLKHPIGSGPFKFVEWKRDDRLVLEPFDKYYEGEVKDWDQLEFRKIAEDSTRVNELLSGGVDIILNVPPNENARIKNHDGTDVTTSASNVVGLLGVNVDKEFPTSDPKVREAIDLAIDKKAITEHVLKGAGVPTRTRVTPGNFGDHPELFNTSLYDVKRAKKLMEEAGYKNGLELTLHAPNDRYFKGKEVVEAIAAMLSEVGIKVNLDFMEWSKFTEMRNAGANKELFFAANGNSLFDAATALDVYTTERAQKELSYSNPEVDTLLAQANSNMNPKDRLEQYRKVQEIVAEERPHIMLYLQSDSYGVSDKVNFKPRMDQMIFAQEITKK
ncbi:ABC transporter substrate-binding protein [Peribacillus cavernae]|uniref:ABC transporter substrate-binding protein n=1 Tax=Peribacillus cavernae TaxID=1674310 RepID=A0A3S0U762_9BACI|nr:ABC transporter substrate-binding protein [Peribacillus cavernae]MDQ0218606.1 peptide/nickel transport system substrate-binding protein [Peribacillus cavernae]RUQ31591.1 ABC transporter substrate-binding protein [Peribacillus cavernae]